MAEEKKVYNGLCGCLYCEHAIVSKITTITGDKITHHCAKGNKVIDELMFQLYMMSNDQKIRPEWCPLYPE